MPKQTIAPVYRYFTADLLTNEILAEIPLRGVNFECALKAAGKFSGKIPITQETDSMDLYNSTMPGNTAIYVVRNGVCVWGGIIWSRSYQFSSRDLIISASEFTSYLYHRKIWKTWNHQYGGTVFNTNGEGWQVALDTGSDVLAKPGSTVHLEFYEPTNFKYNGYYRVANTPTPTPSGFNLVGGAAVADLMTYEVRGGWMYFQTRENHGYATGDALTILVNGEGGVPLETGYTLQATANVPDGPDSNMFRIAVNTPNTPLTVVDGVSSRTLPSGVYTDVTITVRLDTYDYIRTLIDSMFDDFVGTDFPNVYIEPGVSYAIDVVSKEAYDGYCILKTAEPHGIAPGQAIQIQDVGPSFDGEFEITDTPSPTTLVYRKGGTLAPTAVSPLQSSISAITMSSGLATITTAAAHGYLKGQNVEIDLGDAFTDFNGTWTIQDVPSSTTFRYATGSVNSVDKTTLLNATATSGGNSRTVVGATSASGSVTLSVSGDMPFSNGASVSVSNVNRLLQLGEKALDAPNSLATVQTLKPHGLAVGNTVVISGLSDVAEIVAKNSSTTSTVFTTSVPHNFRKGNSVTISGLEGHKITNKVLSSNSVTLTTQQPHNISVGASVTVSDLTDSIAVSNRRIVGGTARITTAATHNIKVNDTVTISGLTDVYTVASKQAVKGYVTLTTNVPHNALVGQKITVTGVGVPFDGTDIEVVDVTATRIMYNVDEKYWDEQKVAAAKKGQTLNVPLNVPLTKASGKVTSIDSYYNGIFTVTAVGSNYFEYWRGGNDQVQTGATGSGYKVTYPSIMNGIYTVTARSANTISYARTANNSASVAVPIVTAEDEVQPLVSRESIHSGARTITAVTTNTFTISQSLPSAVSQVAVLTASRASIFNGIRTITGVPTDNRFTFSLTGYSSSVLEEMNKNLAYASATNLYNGTYTITATDTVDRTFRYTKSLPNYGTESISSRGTAVVRPVVIISTFGPFPGNADMGVRYSSQGYTGVNVQPTAYRGFELKSVGEALDEYSDNINGFEYRVDCSYIEETNEFTKTFVLIPINFPDPPAPGEVAPLSRYGADKLVFEYPGGNITEVSMEESAEESATRFFAVGETDLGPDVGPNIGIASSLDLLQGKDGRKWPLLDASEAVDGVEDEQVLYAHAQRYLSEAAPPYTTLAVSLNGSIAPFVGDYRPGDWCSLVLHDPFARMRMASALEPRSDVIVRKIDSFSVSVPDGVTFPETVSLNLVAEWEVDTRG